MRQTDQQTTTENSKHAHANMRTLCMIKLVPTNCGSHKNV